MKKKLAKHKLNLSENEEIYRNIVENSIQGLVVAMDNPLRIKFASKPMEDITGYSPEELINFKPEQLFGLIHHDDRERFFTSFTNRLKGKDVPPRAEYKLLHKDQSVKWAELYSSFIEINEEPASQAVFIDITERKLAERALKENEERLKSIEKIAHVGSYEIEINTGKAVWSDETYKIFELDPETELAPTVEEYKKYIHKDYKDTLFEVFNKSIETGQRFDLVYRIKTARQKIKYVHSIGEVLCDGNGKPVKMLGTFLDITERKKAEDELKRKEILLRASVESPVDMIILSLDRDYRYIFFNEAHRKDMMEAYGKEPELGKCIFDYMTSNDDIQKIKVRYDKGLKGDSNVSTDIYGDKEKRYYEVRVNPILDENQEIIGITSYSNDITENKRVEEKLKANEEKYRSLFQQHSLGIYIHDLDGKILDVNPVACKQLGYSKHELLKQKIFDFHPEKTSKNLPREEIINQWKQWPEGKQQIVFAEHQRKDGKIIQVQITAGTLDYGNEHHILSIVQDITETKKQERITNAKNKISQIILHKEEDELYAAVIDSVLQIMDSRHGVFGYINDKGALVCPSMTKDIWDECKMTENAIEFPQDTWGDSIWGKALRNKKGVYSNKSFDVPIGHLPIDRFLTIPLVYKNKSIGLIFVGNKPTDYTDEDFSLLQEIADYLAPVIAGAQQRKKIMETLAESEASHKQAQQVAKIGHWQLEAIDAAPIWSDEVFRIFGIEPGQGEPSFTKLDTMIHPEEWPILEEAICDGFNSGKSFDLVFRILRPGNEIGWMQAIGKPEIDPEGNTIKMYGTAQDITLNKLAEHALKESEEKLNLLIKNSNDIIVLINSKGEQFFISSAVEKITGFTPEELIGPLANIVHPDDLEISMQTFARILQNKNSTERLQYRHKHKQKGYVWLEAVGRNYLDNPSINAIIVNTRDISRQKEIEMELTKAKEKAEESEQLKSAFLANMSHEIRTPMNGILGFTALLKNPGLSGEKQAKYVEIIRKSGDRMLATVNDIINISKIDAGHVDISKEDININEEIEAMYVFFRQEALDKGLDLKLNNKLPHQNMSMITDKVKLNSITSNLIKNALRYTDKGSIEISCSKKSATLEIKIIDTGIGIPKNRIDSIFNRFEQADIADIQARGGSGLGLSISKSYVEMLGGHIGVESEVDKGSVFWFTIPWIEDNEKQKSAAGPEELKSNGDKRFNILIVEDDDISYEHLNIITESIAKNTAWVTNGKDAVEFMKRNDDTQLILMDIKLPVMNGTDATREIRKFNKNVIIIAQTAYGLSGDREMAIEAGCNDYIAKPINQEKLHELINKYKNVI